MMPRILFFSEAVSLAHVSRPVQLALTLGREWEVQFACADQYDICFKGTNWERHSISSISPSLFMKRLNSGSPLYKQDELSAYVKEDLSLIQKLKPDVVVGDFRLSLSVAARVAQVPYFSICNAHWSPWAEIGQFPLPDIPLTSFFGPKLALPLFQLGRQIAFKIHARPLNTIRRRYGLNTLFDLRFTYTDSDMTLFVDTPSLVPTRNLPLPHRYIGPVIWSPDIGKPSWWSDLPSDPIVYVTLGTTGRADILHILLEVLENAGFVTLVATAGRADIASIQGKRFVARYLPGEIAADRSQFVICNGGSATAYQALSRGKCVLGLCSNMDQFLTMGCIERFGAGIAVRASTANRRVLAHAINQLAVTESFQHAACKARSEFINFSSKQLFPKTLAEYL